MAGILDLLKNIEFKPNPVGMGLLQMGANMLQNSGPSRQPVSFGQSLGSGLQGFGEGALVGGHFQNQQKKNKEAEELKKALAQIDINQPPEKLAQQLASIGMISEALPLVKPKDVNPRAGIPTGFNPTGNPGEIASQTIDLGNGEKIPYLDYQMMLWNQKQQTPSYGEPERLDMAREDQGLQRAQFALSQENAARAAAQTAESNRMIQERLDMEKKARQNSLLRDVPAQIQKGYVSNNSSLDKIDQAIKAVEDNPNAFGMKNVLGDTLTQRLDPDGVAARAAVSEVASVKRHDISGAAVTIAEQPFLKPFLPSPTDTPEATIKKLKQIRANIETTNNEMAKTYGEQGKYRNPLTPKEQSEALRNPEVEPEKNQPPKRRATDKPVQINSDDEWEKLAPGTLFLAPGETVPRRK